MQLHLQKGKDILTFMAILLILSLDAKYAMPIGTFHLNEATFEEFCIPPSEHGLEQAQTCKLVNVSASGDEILTKAFPSYTTLNRMQSIVFPVAYHSRENLLISAPTGAGKTDVALLTVLQCIRDNMLTMTIHSRSFTLLR